MSLRADLRYGLRAIRLRPGWAAAAVVTFALGIGANATMLTLVDRLLLRPPPHIHEPARVMRVALEFAAGGGQRFAMSTTSYPVFTDLTAARRFASLAAVSRRQMVYGAGADASSVEAASVSGDYFALLGTRPALGRFFTSAEDRPPAGAPVAVISHAFWRRGLGASPDALSHEIELDGVTYQIIGIAPSDFTGETPQPTDVWIPLHAGLAQVPGDWANTRGMRLVGILGRLRDGASAPEAAQEASALVRRGMEISRGADPTAHVLLEPVAPGLRLADRSPQGRITLWVAAMSLVVFFIAIVNVANLTLLRAAGRRREVAVRRALGATTWRVTRRLLVECLLLAALGGAAALFVAAWSGEATRALLLPEYAGPERLLSIRLVVITGAATLVAGLFTGLVPALRARRPSLVTDLRTGAVTTSPERSWLPTALLVTQATLCMVLLVGAALFVLSLHRVRGQDFGFSSDGVLFAEMRFPHSIPGAVQDELYREAEGQVRRLPGVESATVVQAAPFGGHNVPPIAVPGRPDFPDETQQIPFLVAATPDYFAVLGMTIREGRNFTPADGAGTQLVTVINQAMADALWPGESALGKCIRAGFVPGQPPAGMQASPTLPCRVVIGVVNNARPRSIREESGQARMQYYIPFGQLPAQPFAGGGPSIWGLLLRTRDADRLAVPVQRRLQSFAPNLPYAAVRPLQDVLDRQMRPWLLGATMFTVFGFLALGLAAVGLYGVRAYSVARRTREIGVRMALGAREHDVLRQILTEGLKVTALGVTLGSASVIGLARLVEPLLFETSATDFRVLVTVALVLVAVAIAASVVPAWRAARVDPNTALRME